MYTMSCIYTTVHVHIHVIVVSWFLQCMGFVLREGFPRAEPEEVLRPRKYIQHEGGTILCTVKTMRQLTCTDRLYQISFSTRMSIL